MTEFRGLSGDLYEIGAPIYQGRFVTVYKATKNGTDPVAVKELRNSKAGDASAEYYYEGRLLEREWEVSQSLRSLPHEHLLLVDDRFSISDAEYYVMPLAEKDLAALMGRVSDEQVLEIVRQIAAGLQELSVASVLHRDIKPSNVLYFGGAWRLADFGVSKIEGNSGTATWTGTGTLDYWAPELFSGNSENVLTDMYSLGCLVYALRMGQPPFLGSSNLRRDHETVVPVIDAAVGPVLGRLINRLLAKDPQARPSSPEDVLRLCGRVESALQERFLQVELAYSKMDALEDANRARQQRTEKLYQDAAARLEYVVETAYAQLQEMSIDVIFSKEQRTSTWFLRLKRHQLNVVLSANQEWDHEYDLVCFASIVLLQEGASSSGRVKANLVCEETENGLRWSIIRFRQESSQEMFGIATDSDFLRAYPFGWPSNSIVLALRAALTSESLLELFSAVVLQELDVEDPPVRPPARRDAAEMFAMFDPELSLSTGALDYETKIGVVISGFGMGDLDRNEPSGALDYVVRAQNGGLAAVEVKHKKRGQLVRKDLVKAVAAADRMNLHKVVVVTNAPLSEEVREINGVGFLDGVEVEAVTWENDDDTGLLQRVIARSFR
ncbi:serine/threonine-protein kinase [Streptomyces sp. ID05-26A]|nr:serine/threonine-protein kinase [Streptomyces sp. ID05-26A]